MFMLVQALRQIGIQKLNELQKVAIPKVAKGLNVLITAPTGSGKTECAIIPIFNKMLKTKPEGITLLYITPLRALNRDMIRRIEKLAKLLGFTIAVRHGDTSNFERRKQALKPPQILITTPETFQLLFLGKRLREALKNVRFVVIDEIHELAESKRGVQLAVALERLKEITDFQIIGLSATLKNAKEVAEYFGINEVVEWNFKKRYDVSVLSADNEIDVILKILDKHESALIFTNTRQTAEALGLKLKEKADVEVHHSSLSKEVRIEAERRFANKELKALVCTASMELGIDIGHIDVVVQFNSPREVKRLIQRVGRSGHRLDEVSKGFIIASNFDDILESWAIVKRVEDFEIEEVKLYKNCLDVLANQIVAISLEYGQIDLDKCYSIIKRAKPFEDLEFDEFLAICGFLHKEKLVFLDGNILKATRKGRRYFYENISMIPDEKKFKVVDITSGKTIGYLDESFVSSFDAGVFAIKGELWRIVAVDEVVRVEPVKAEGVIPSWVGEEIPVPFEVAQDVGKIRKWIAGLLNVMDKKEIVETLKEMFKTNEKACELVISKIEEQIRKGFTVPSDNHITVEGEGLVVINACFGHKVNETLAKVISLFLPKPVEIEVEPYRIKIKSNTNAKDVARILNKINPDEIEKLVEIALIDTKLLQWKIVEIARRFGYLSKNTDTTRINLKNLVLRLKDTPIYREAINEILHERMDVIKAKEVLRAIQSGVIAVSVYEELSPISTATEFSIGDVVANRDQAILEAFKRRLEEEECYMICLNCGCKIKTKVKFIDKFECIRCKSRLVACINARRRIEEFSKEELFRIANAVMCYKKRAVYALNTFGVGINTAIRILTKPFRSDEEFFKELIEAEKRFVRTRMFWD